MSLRQRLDDDLKDAMRKGDVARRSTLRYLRSAIHNQEIAIQQKTLDDEGITAVLGRQAQQRRESIEAFSKGRRPDLVAKEEAKLALILGYLPAQMGRGEIAEVARRAIEQVGARGPQDMGKVMGKVMPQVRGKAEGRDVSAVVSELLRSLAP